MSKHRELRVNQYKVIGKLVENVRTADATSIAFPNAVRKAVDAFVTVSDDESAGRALFSLAKQTGHPYEVLAGHVPSSWLRD